MSGLIIPAFVVLTTIAVLAVLWPVLRRPRPPQRERYEIEIYRDQLAEVERDRERGLIPAAEARAAQIEIERRLHAAAAGDFVTVLYNPASARRRQGLARALEILRPARPPDTPLVHARNLGRPGETLAMSPLAEFDPSAVDMLSLLIVGSSRTRMFVIPDGRPLVYTPRGYHLAGRPAV